MIFERAKFNMRVQKEGEPVDNFITDLYSLAEHCNFGTLHDKLIRDRIVVGIRDKALSEKLQLEAELTLERAIDQVRQKKAVRKQQLYLEQRGIPQANLMWIMQNEREAQKSAQKVNSGKEQFKQTKSTPAVTTKQKCERCNGPLHGRMKCPARDSLCNNCGRKVHWKEACRSKTVSQVTEEIEDTTQQFDESPFLGEVIEAIHSDERYSQPRMAEVLVNNNRASFKLDSRAVVTVIPLELYEKLCN